MNEFEQELEELSEPQVEVETEAVVEDAPKRKRKKAESTKVSITMLRGYGLADGTRYEVGNDYELDEEQVEELSLAISSRGKAPARYFRVK